MAATAACGSGLIVGSKKKIGAKQGKWEDGFDFHAPQCFATSFVCWGSPLRSSLAAEVQPM
jgi:hypothetical protein